MDQLRQAEKQRDFENQLRLAELERIQSRQRLEARMKQAVAFTVDRFPSSEAVCVAHSHTHAQYSVVQQEEDELNRLRAKLREEEQQEREQREKRMRSFDQDLFVKGALDKL